MLPRLITFGCTSHCLQDRLRFVLSYPQLIRISKHHGSGPLHWPLGNSFDWHAFRHDGTQSTSASWHVRLRLASYPWLRQDPLTKRNKRLLPLLRHLAGWASMLCISFLGYTRSLCNLTVRLGQGKTCCLHPTSFCVHWSCKSNYPGLNIHLARVCLFW